MDAAEVELVGQSLRHVLESSEPADVPAALLAADWADLVATEPAVAIGVLGGEQGRALRPAPTLDLVLQHGAGLPLDTAAAFVLPPLRRGAERAAEPVASGLRVDGLLLGGAERAQHLVVPVAEGLLAVPASSLRLEPVRGFHPGAGLHLVRGDVPHDANALLAPPDAWSAALATGRRFLAAELVGLAGRMLDDAVAHVLAREQFGRAIGSFQAVKHRLADVHVAIGAAGAGLAAAWEVGDASSAIAAKCLATRAHRLAATHGHQVTGGIAFTVEHGFHRFVQRGHLLDGLLGAADDLVRQLGRRLIDAGSVPRVPRIGDATAVRV